MEFQGIEWEKCTQEEYWDAKPSLKFDKIKGKAIYFIKKRKKCSKCGRVLK